MRYSTVFHQSFRHYQSKSRVNLSYRSAATPVCYIVSYDRPTTPASENKLCMLY